ncbi:KamA family radical SAM protein [Desulfatirhabdium butyrativorans]|uniref:KamA family radical SAM protein n=1 Tax=Desulfatirhabdium butyrativorans TaxID=340467 RepID=UPI000425FE36|nr:KamA family radical SAM protein [Desulfatirhabdium butyrativorans]
MYTEVQCHQGKPPDFPRRKLREIDAFPIGESSDAFRERHFPDCSQDQWNDWIWQLRHSFKSAEALSPILALTADETEAIQAENHRLPLRITPYYASLCLNPDPQDPLRRTVIPTTAEWARNPAESLDPLAEDSHSPVPGLVHRYPDRALFLVSEQCACYCRYCTRSRRVGVKRGIAMGKAVWEKAVSYIEATPSIRDVIISGGDPLMLPDDAIVWLLAQICRIPHVEMVRIGTKIPVVLPQRITHALVAKLKPFKPLYVSLHVTHPSAAGQGRVF